MSADNDINDGEDEAGVLAPKVNTQPRVHRMNDGVLSGGRTELNSPADGGLRDSLWMSQYGGDRNLFDALGYIREPKYKHYRARYARTDTAPALVDKLPKKAWSQPEPIDTGHEGEGQSEWEEEVENLLSGRYTPEDPVNIMERASRMERLGNFSLIFLGLNDANVAGDNPSADDLEKPVDEQSLADMDPGEALSYITPYDQGRIDLDSIQWEDQDPTSERFGKPKSYMIDFGDGRPTKRVHWSRVVHVVGNVFDNEFKSPSVLKQSLNRIDDIEKILGGSAEGYWRSAYQGLVISPPEVNGQMTEFSDDGESVHQQIERYINNFSREIFTPAEVDPIEVSAQDPLNFLESQYKDLSAGHDIPQSILMGNETGERATQEDRRMWYERVEDFREEYCQPAVLNPFIKRLERFGILPEPEGDKDWDWPPLQEKTETEKADTASTWANALSAGTGGNPLQAVSIGEFREEILGLDPERGSEADDANGEMEAVVAEDLEVDESDERVQEQFARLNQQYEEEDKVRVPDGRGVVVDVLTEGFDAEGETVEASEAKPKYVVVTENEDQPFGFYEASEIEKDDWDAGIENPEEDLKEEEGEDRENRLVARIEQALARNNQEGHFTWPESWRESNKPARLIALDAWVSMGGSVSACMREMRGEIASPARFCADFADRLYQWEYWRGDSWAPGD